MLRTRINQAMVDAMKAKNQIALSTSRLILAAIKDHDIAARTEGNAEGITDNAIIEILTKMMKQRQESIALYEQAGRVELVDQEKKEMQFIESFLPPKLSDDEAAIIIHQTLQDLGCHSLKDMGRVMQVLRQNYASQMDFVKVGQLIKQKLAG